MADAHELDGTLTQGASAPDGLDVAAITGTLGRFRIESKIGEGAMGVVYAAFDPDLQRRVALKILRRAEVGPVATEGRARFLREARAMANVSHPNVVAVHEVGTAQGLDYIAMEFIDGGSLAAWLAEAQPSAREIVAAMLTAGQGLAAAHARGLVHRDFKPQNVLRSRTGRILVTDFGLARAFDPTLDSGLDAAAWLATLPPGAVVPPDEGTPTQPQLTVTGAVVGTPAYMAPEQWTGGAVGPASDQFALAVALWEGLTRVRPFQGASLAQLRANIVDGARTMTSNAVGRRLCKVLHRAMARDASARYPSMPAFLAAVEAAQRPWLTRRAVGLGGLALLVAGAVLAVALARGGGPAGSPLGPICDASAAQRAHALWPGTRGLLWFYLNRDWPGGAMRAFVSEWSET